MSEDKPYRFERKRIDPNEIHSRPITENEVLNTQKSIATMEGGTSIQGNLPPAMLQLLQQKNLAEKADDDDPQPMMMPPTYMNQNPTPISSQSKSEADAFQVALNRANKNPEKSIATRAFVPEVQINDPALNELISALNTQNYDKISLPSLGKFYHTPDTPTEGWLEIRPMTGKEEAILSSSRHMRNGQGIEMIFRNCIKQKNIDVTKLLSSDCEFILVYLRAISYGHLYEVKLSCPYCDHNFDHQIDLNLNVDYCGDDWNEERLVKVLPASNLSFKYRFMTSGDETMITNFTAKKDANPDAINDLFLYKASLLIEWIGNETSVVRNQPSIRRLLDNLLAEDVNYIRNLLSEEACGVQKMVEIPCPNCQKLFNTRMPYNENFFSPKVKVSN